ncbi:HAD family acid phosphatase [Actinoplanes subglobosus]|uniref:HAD family acid phosphatase n=1 Tax=Actinoplanes subglobosus TaxID=1547892 RepID=A0ABV8J6V3_9ACTN
MRTLSLRILVTTVTAALLTGAAATPASAAALPSRATWLADVQAVTDQAADYLDDRLPASGIRAAIVLDIDNTALQSKYKPYDATPSVLALSRQARADGAAVFFVTARPEIIEAATEINLSVVGYQWTDIYTRPTFDFSDNQTLKTKARIDIEKRGYTIVANVGNSATDLGGGHAERTYKLPDYDGQLD